MLVDIIVVIIALIAAIIGMRRGLMLSILSLCSLTICVVVAGLFSYPVSFAISGMGVVDRFQAVAIAFIVLFILCCIGLLILRGIIKLIHRLPVIKQLDTIGGLLIGLVCGALIVSVFAVALHMFGEAEEIQPILKAVDDSTIMKYFYEKNYIELIMKAL